MAKKLRWISEDGVWFAGIHLQHGKVYEVEKDIPTSALTIWGFEGVKEETSKTKTTPSSTSKPSSKPKRT